jgi:hypothetical protein
MIISASRRTDIPKLYSEWFMNRIKEGYVLTRNPMNHAQISKIMLSTDIVDCIVFWTKDPLNMMNKLNQLDIKGYSYYFQFTLTPYGKEIEPNLREKNEIVQTFIQLSNQIGNDKVLWRYDPILLNQNITIDYHKRAFKQLCQTLSGYTKVCTISFVDKYPKLNKILKSGEIQELSSDEMIQLAEYLFQTGKQYGIEVRACCEELDLTDYGIKAASCIDKSTIEAITGSALDIKLDVNQRPGCGCIQSIDIGVYNTCDNGCIYCYANYSASSVLNNMKNHNKESDILIGTVMNDEKVITKKVKSLKIEKYKQEELFK